MPPADPFHHQGTRNANGMLCHQKLSVVLASRKLGGGRTGCDEAGNSSGKSLVSSW